MRRHCGLTIIEALIAVAIIGIVFVAIASLQISSLRVTSAAQADSALLSEAVTVFERVRTKVLEDFPDLYVACTEASPCGNFVEDGAEIVLERALDVAPGLLRLTIAVEGRDRSLVFAQFVSCLDQDDVPTMTDPKECEKEGT